MAGETILVVDDQPLNLKLVAAVLRSEGYRVQLASSGEQALTMLNTTRPDLMLVDLQLPGIDGLELTRRVRTLDRMKGVPVVALTASTSGVDEASAYEAGCDGYITKPLDTRTLVPRLKAFLEGHADTPIPAEEAGALPGGLKLMGPEMEGLRRTFLADGTRETLRLLELVNQFDAKAAGRLFHQWIGGAGALGYMEIAARARAAETLLTKPGWTKNELREALTALLYEFSSPKEASETAIPESILQELRRKHIALVGFADEEADKVCAAFERARALARLFGADEPLDSEAVRGCTVLMVHVRPETLGSAWLEADGGLPAGLPLVLVGAREHLLELDARVQARACEYLIDGWQPEEVVMRLSFAISRAARAEAPQKDAPAPTEAPVARAAPVSSAAPVAPQRAADEKPDILVADDDRNVTAVVQAALERLGMSCRWASNGTEALYMLHERCPRAAVLDVNMPGMDGFEVLSAIRKEGLPIKVVMLTARQQEADVLRGFSLGADDYVVKPFNPLELAARLRRLL